MEKQAASMMGEPVSVIVKLETAEAVRKAISGRTTDRSMLSHLAANLVAGADVLCLSQYA